MIIIDTNVLIDYPEILEQETNLGITWSVLEELDRLKITKGERARKARIVLNRLKTALEKEKKKSNTKEKNKEEEINKEYKEINFIKIPECYLSFSVDNQLLYLCRDNNYTLITNDINLQVKCIALDVNYESYKKDTEIYTGILQLNIPEENDLISQLYSNDFTNLTLYENQYIIIMEDEKPKDVLVYRHGSINQIQRKTIRTDYEKELRPLNVEQECLFDALYSDSTIVYGSGPYGTGKTLLMTGYAVQELQKGHINKIVYVPNNSYNEDSMELGALPGCELDKILPLMGGICDHLSKQQVIQFYENGQLELMPISMARGRNIEDSIILVNEAQNLTEEHIKLLIGRCGKGARIFFDGDIKQADSNIFRQKSGLKLLTKLRFSEEYGDLFSAVKLKTIERSKTAQAAQFLDEI